MPDTNAPRTPDKGSGPVLVKTITTQKRPEGTRPEGFKILNSLHAADMFVDRYAREVAYVEGLGWLGWNGRCWEPGDAGAREKVKQLSRDLTQDGLEAVSAGNKTPGKRLAGLGLRVADRPDSILRLSQSDPRIRFRAEDLDNHDDLLNVNNGTLDLSTGDLMPHDPDDLLTKVAGTWYAPDAPRPTFDRFLSTVLPNPDLRAYVKRIAGYMLAGGNPERILPVFYGVGRNGKTVLVEILLEVMGDYGTKTPVSTFLAKRTGGPTNDLARLRGARLISASEFEEGARTNIALVKEVTGDGKITARFLHKEFIEFRLSGTVLLDSNHMPWVGAGPAVWDRLRIIPFEVRIPEEDVDPDLKAKLRRELPGILAWAVEGYQEYRERGLDEPAAVLQASMAERSEQDIVGQFIEEWCVRSSEAEVTKADLFAAYSEWCQQAKEFSLTKRQFGARMKESGFGARRGAKGVELWTGIGLCSERTPLHHRP
jgi:putative DNA primase/helicase